MENTESSEVLLPCPFCGAEVIRTDENEYVHGISSIRSCFLTALVIENINDWNTRSKLPAKSELVPIMNDYAGFVLGFEQELMKRTGFGIHPKDRACLQNMLKQFVERFGTRPEVTKEKPDQVELHSKFHLNHVEGCRARITYEDSCDCGLDGLLLGTRPEVRMNTVIDCPKCDGVGTWHNQLCNCDNEDKPCGGCSFCKGIGKVEHVASIPEVRREVPSEQRIIDVLNEVDNRIPRGRKLTIEYAQAIHALLAGQCGKDAS